MTENVDENGGLQKQFLRVEPFSKTNDALL